MEELELAMPDFIVINKRTREHLGKITAKDQKDALSKAAGQFEDPLTRIDIAPCEQVVGKPISIEGLVFNQSMIEDILLEHLRMKYPGMPEGILVGVGVVGTTSELHVIATPGTPASLDALSQAAWLNSIQPLHYQGKAEDIRLSSAKKNNGSLEQYPEIDPSNGAGERKQHY